MVTLNYVPRWGMFLRSTPAGSQWAYLVLVPWHSLQIAPHLSTKGNSALHPEVLCGGSALVGGFSPATCVWVLRMLLIPSSLGVVGFHWISRQEYKITMKNLLNLQLLKLDGSDVINRCNSWSSSPKATSRMSQSLKLNFNISCSSLYFSQPEMN